MEQSVLILRTDCSFEMQIFKVRGQHSVTGTSKSNYIKNRENEKLEEQT